MGRVKIKKHDDGTISYERGINSAPNDGIAVRLIKKGKACQGARVEITQSADGMEFYGKIMEAKE